MARAKGPLNPGKYPAPVGQNYNRYGEQPGYIYNPYTDKYVADPKVQGQYLESQGLGEPKPPGLGETILPIAATAGALYGAQALAPKLVGNFSTAATATTPASAGSGLLGAIESGGSSLFGSGTAAAQTGAASPASTFLGPGGDPSALLPGGSATTELGGAVGGGAPVPPGLGMQALGYGGAALGAYNAFEGIKEKDPIQAGLGGAGVWAGLNMAGVGGLAGLTNPIGWGLVAAPTLIALANKMGDKDMWKTEGNRLRKLQKGGAYVPEGLLAAMPTGGRSKEQLIAEAEASGGNVTFARSRDEKDLTAQDIIGYATFAEKDPEWFNKPLDQQLSVAQQALDSGAVREHHGTIDVDWKKVGDVPAPAAPAPNQTQLQTNKPLPGGERKPKRRGRNG